MITTERDISYKAQDVLMRSGLSGADIDRLRRIKDKCRFISVHGSCITGTLADRSDIDFTVISDDIERETEELSEAAGVTIDYQSKKIIGESGRPMSFHVQRPSFREEYGSTPVAYEFRLNKDSKGKNSKYALSAVGRQGNYVVSLECPSIPIDGVGQVNVVPQTGAYRIENNIVIPSMGDHVFTLGDKRFYDPCTGQEYQPPPNDDIMLLGLEYNKAVNDIPLSDDEENYDRYVIRPIENTFALFHDFRNNDPTEDILAVMTLHAEYRNAESGRLKTNIGYIDDVLRPKLHTIMYDR